MAQSTKQKILLLLIILAGLLLRLFRLGYHDIWYDEGISLTLARHYQDLWSAPLYYSILHFWIKLFGRFEFSLRFPSFIFSTLCIPAIYTVSKKLFNRKTGLIAAAIMAFSPMQIWYAQEARPHSLALLLGIISTYFLIMTAKGGLKRWVYFTIFSILGLLSSEFYIVLLLAHALIFIAYTLNTSNKNAAKSLFLSLFIISLSFLPWALRYLDKLIYIRDGFWVPMPDISSLKITFENLLLGYNLSHVHYLIADTLIVLLLIFAFKSVYSGTTKTRGNFYACLFMALFPILSIYVFSKIIVPVYLDRNLTLFSPSYYILLALGIGHISKRKTGLFVLPVFCFLFLFAIISFYQDLMPTPFKHHIGTYIKKPVKPLIEFIEENLEPGDIIAFANHSTRPACTLHSKKIVQYYYFFDPDILGTDWGRPIKKDKHVIPKQEILSLEARRIWLVASNWHHDGELDKQSQSVKEYMDKEMTLRQAKNIYGKWVYLYEKDTN